MGTSNEYNLASSGGGGKLKLKGAKVTDGRVEKKKGKKKRKQLSEDPEGSKSRDESEDVKKGVVAEEGAGSGAGGGDDEEGGQSKEGEVVVGKTEAERKYEEIRRKRLDERLKREGVKTHKERVEELNKYLSNLSEHHDMPRIGPG
ncbi:hypothetical protein FQN54_009110 [Arachnomyces sp. PD_36]|nr:hypothetical protein FQN54_009110 [Arachnomyces sp. PD_36]